MDPDPYSDPNFDSDVKLIPPNPFSSVQAAQKAEGSTTVPGSWPPDPTPADDTEPSWYDVAAGADFSPENADAVKPEAKPFRQFGSDVYANGGAVGEDHLKHVNDRTDTRN